MHLFRRLAPAFVISLAVCGVIQQIIIVDMGDRESVKMFAVLAGIIALITALFAVVARKGRRQGRFGQTAATLLSVMLGLGLTAYAIGVAYLQPGFGGNLLYKLALFIDFWFLLPAALAVPIHWLLLRAFATRSQARSGVAE